MMNGKVESSEERQQYKNAFILLLVVVPLFCALYRFPQDDGLRHVGLAFGNLTSWGDVYPYSVFERFRDYDPWYGYDLSLKAIAGLLKLLPLSTLTLSFLLAKFLVLTFLLLFLYLVVSRSGILDEIKDLTTFTLALVILLVLLTPPLQRAMTIRPFILGTLFLLYSIDQKGMANGAVSALVLSFFYPYLSWLYILPAAFGHFVRGDKKFALGAMLFMVPFLLMQPSSFWGFQVALVSSDSVRNGLALNIGEFDFTLKTAFFYSYLASFIILYPKFSQKNGHLKYAIFLTLIYLAPALKYVRYFWDLILPLVFVCFAKDILRVLLEPYRKSITLGRSTMLYYFGWIQSFSRPGAEGAGSGEGTDEARSEISLKPYLAAGYLFIFAIFIFFNIKEIRSLRSFRQGLAAVPQNALVLSSFNLQYKTLFVRPDLRIVPSCEAGFAAQFIAKEYADFINRGLVSRLSKKAGIRYYLDDRNYYIDPREGKYLKFSTENGYFTVWEIVGFNPGGA